MSGTVHFKTETLSLYEDHHGFWLWDETRQMNLAMKAKSERDAFVTAMKYYQDRLKRVETAYGQLTEKVDEFVDFYEGEERI